jgi:putative transposase
MEKKEFYRKNLPHFQQPGQAYFVTWCMHDAVPPKALERYSIDLRNAKSEIEIATEKKVDETIIHELGQKYYSARRKYMKAFDDLLHSQTEFSVDLSKEENSKIVIDTLCFWEGKRLENYALCVMPNHVHWVFKTFEQDENGKLVYLQDILQSVKRFSSNKLNKLVAKTGTVWQSESFDTTIRDNVHLQRAIDYTLNNPVAAGLVQNWQDWNGTLFREHGVLRGHGIPIP